MQRQRLSVDLGSLLLFACLLYLKLSHLQTSLTDAPDGQRPWQLGVLAVVVTILAILALFRPWPRLRAFLVIDLLLTAVLLTDQVYWRYFHDVPSVSLLKHAKLAGEVKSSVTALLRWGDLLYLPDLVLVAALAWSKRAKQVLRPAGMRFGLQFSLAALLLVAGLFMNQRSLADLEQSQPGLLQTLYNRKYVAEHVGVVNYHLFDAWRFADSQMNKPALTTADWSQIASRFADNSHSAPKQHFGSLAGKNLIMVQLEAFQAFVLNRRIGGQEITPNLNSLAKSSLSYEQTYYQTAWGGTSDAEFLSNVSMLPAREGSAYYQFAGNTFHSLPGTLAAAGYHTAVMHANTPGFWNRLSMYRSLGFQDYQNVDDFQIDESFGLGLTDASFYRQAVAKMEAYEQPFHAFLISLSSHFPFKDDAHPLPETLDVGQFAGTLMGDYLQAIHFADMALGELIAELKAADLWDESLVVFYGDHAAIPFEGRDMLAQLIAERDDLSQLEWFREQRVPLIIHLPGDALRGPRQTAAGQIDIYPTVANLLGISAPYALGNDLLNTAEGFVCFRNNMWLTDEAIYFGIDQQLFDLESGDRLPMDKYQAEMAKLQETIKVSDLTLEHDLIEQISIRLGD